MQKPKIQLHLPDLYVGGIERWALTLMNGLPEIEWYVSTPPSAVSHQSALDEFRGVAVVGENDASLKMDALITTWGTSNRSVRPTIAVAHSAFDKYKTMMQTVRYDHAVAVSREASLCFPSAVEVETIYNGVDLSRLQATETRAATRARLGLAHDAFVIGYVGRWGYQKNPLAAAIAAREVAGAVVLYVGPTPEPSAMQEARRLAECRFLSAEDVGHIGDVYAAMDTCLVASRTEGFGLVIAEAWCCRIPVIATSVGIAAEHPELVLTLSADPDAAALKHAVETVKCGRNVADLNKAHTTAVETYGADRMVADWRRYIFSRLG